MGNACQLNCDDKPGPLVPPVQVVVSSPDGTELIPGLKPAFYDDALPVAKKKKVDADPTGKVLPGSRDFQVEFSTLGQRLGIHIRHDTHGGIVKVKGIDPGSAADLWNVSNPDMRVAEGSSILAINGKNVEDMGPKELLNAFKRTPSISITVRPPELPHPGYPKAAMAPPRVTSMEHMAVANLRRSGDASPEAMSPVSSFRSRGGSSRGRESREAFKSRSHSRMTSVTTGSLSRLASRDKDLSVSRSTAASYSRPRCEATSQIAEY
mmetsp:Transcript_69452/g.166497  ORF Transcript_69452/g.166497 Transcript_69452/m.166497 type:complete len:266 (+) Transcript_69452:45-842(+)